MAILDRRAITAAIDAGRIVVRPYDPACLRVNSYDVHLSPFLLRRRPDSLRGLDCAEEPEMEELIIPPEGFWLQPQTLYLGATMEYTEAHGLVPWLDGKSSSGRLGLSVHITAGRGDAGFCGHWTLEMTVPEPLRIHAAMPAGQLTWFTVEHAEGGEHPDYGTLDGSKYQNQGPRPVASRMHRNFPLPDVWLARAAAMRAGGSCE